MKKNLPGVTIITPFYKPDLRICRKMFDSVSMQEYPQENIEHLIIDGGSSSKHLQLVGNYTTTSILSYPHLQEKPLERMAIGIQKANHNLVLFLAADNILVGSTWLQEMVKPFIENKNIVSSFSKHNAPFQGMSAMGRYFSYIGSNDVLLNYLEKSEKLPVDKKTYSAGSHHVHKSGYTLIDFNSETLPTLGDNGHMAHKKLLLKEIGKPEKYIHVDVFARLVNRGFATHAVIDNSIVHIVEGNLFTLLKRRVYYKNVYYDSDTYVRDYLVFNPALSRDMLRLILFGLASITFIQPIFRSMRGYFYNRDPAWFLHIPVTFFTFLFYSYSQLRILFRKIPL